MVVVALSVRYVFRLDWEMLPIGLGPLHTRAESRDHKIVRVQKKVSKGHPNTPPKSCSVVTDP